MNETEKKNVIRQAWAQGRRMDGFLKSLRAQRYLRVPVRVGSTLLMSSKEAAKEPELQHCEFGIEVIMNRDTNIRIEVIIGAFDGVFLPVDGRVYEAEGDTPIVTDDLAGREANALWHRHAQWSRKTFGEDGVRGPGGPLKHLLKEAKEALDNPHDYSEYADCLLLVFDAARRAGLSFAALIDVTNRKMSINEMRDWGNAKSRPDDAVEHVKD